MILAKQLSELSTCLCTVVRYNYDRGKDRSKGRFFFGLKPQPAASQPPEEEERTDREQIRPDVAHDKDSEVIALHEDPIEEGLKRTRGD